MDNKRKNKCIIALAITTLTIGIGVCFIDLIRKIQSSVWNQQSMLYASQGYVTFSGIQAEPGTGIWLNPADKHIGLKQQGELLAEKTLSEGNVNHQTAVESATTANYAEAKLRHGQAVSRLMTQQEVEENHALLEQHKLDTGSTWWTSSTSANKALIIDYEGRPISGRTVTINKPAGIGACTPVTETLEGGWQNTELEHLVRSATYDTEPRVYTKLTDNLTTTYLTGNNYELSGQALLNRCLEEVDKRNACRAGRLNTTKCREPADGWKVGDVHTIYTATWAGGGWKCYSHGYSEVQWHWTKAETSCTTNLEAAQAGTRPLITINPTSILFASTSSTENRTPTRILSTNHQITRSLSASTSEGYKLTLLDSDMSISEIKTTDVDPSVIKQSGNKIYIKKGTTTLNLNTDIVGDGESTPNGISALSSDSTGNEVFGTLASISGAGTHEISIDLSNLMDVNTLGSSKTISIYAEQQNGPKTTDYMSAPYDIEVVVSEEQKLSLDTESMTKTSVMYGEALELTAQVNEGDTAIGWADTALTVSVPEADKAKVEITSQEWDATTGKVLVKLKPLTGNDATFQLELNKDASSSDESYLKADTVKTQPIILKSRPITITPKGYLLYDGDSFTSAFPWEFETKLSDESISGDALVNSDTLPYTIETIALTENTPSIPTVDADGNLTTVNGGKEWGLSLKGKDVTETETFEKKYAVTKNNYHAVNNPISKLRIDAFKGIEITKQPDDAMAKKDDTYRFIVEAKYDVNIPNHTDTSDIEYQEFTYQWEISTDSGSTWEAAPGSNTISYDDTNGIATLTYTGTNVQTEDEGALFRCRVWNKRNVIENTMPTSDEAELSVRTDPAVFIEIPKTVEMEKTDTRLISTKDMQKIKLVEFDNKVSTNKPGKQTIPEGTFQIDTDPTFQLALIQGVEEARKAKYDVTVYKEDNRTPLSKHEELMTLNQKDKKEGGFYIRTMVDNDKPRGIYKGKMVFTITYTPKSISE